MIRFIAALFCVYAICSSSYAGTGEAPDPVATPQQTVTYPATCSPKTYMIPQQVAVPQPQTVQQQRVVMRPQTQIIETEQEKIIYEPKTIKEKVQQEVTTYVPEVITEEVQVQTQVPMQMPMYYQYVPQQSYGTTQTYGTMSECMTPLQIAVLNAQRAIGLMEDDASIRPGELRRAKRALARLLRKVRDRG